MVGAVILWGRRKKSRLLDHTMSSVNRVNAVFSNGFDDDSDDNVHQSPCSEAPNNGAVITEPLLNYPGPR